MRYEVQKQVEEIDKALGIITLYQIPNMDVSKEELKEALKKAESCMRLMMSTLTRKDITMKELNQEISNKEPSKNSVPNKYEEIKKAVQNIEWDIIHKLPDYSGGDKKGNIRKMKELMQRREYDEDLIENINNDFCQGFDIAKRIIIEMHKNEIERYRKLEEEQEKEAAPENVTRFELFIINDEQFTDYEVGKCISEPDYGNGFSEFNECVRDMDVGEIAEELYAQTNGAYRYVIDARYTYTGSFYKEPDSTYTYEIVSKEPSTHFQELEQKQKNTKISYLYRDGSNYKQHNEEIVSGTFTPEQIDTMIGCLDGDLFIPSQIGFSELRFGEITEDDTCWFELNKDGFEETDQASTIDATPEEIVARFLTAKDHWEEYDLQQDEQEETYE